MTSPRRRQSEHLLAAKIESACLPRFFPKGANCKLQERLRIIIQSPPALLDRGRNLRQSSADLISTVRKMAIKWIRREHYCRCTPPSSRPCAQLRITHQSDYITEKRETAEIESAQSDERFEIQRVYVIRAFFLKKGVGTCLFFRL